eukprot:339860_1
MEIRSQIVRNTTVSQTGFIGITLFITCECTEVYQIFSRNQHCFTLKSQVEHLIVRRRDGVNQFYAKETFEWNFIQIARGAKGTITKGSDGMTEIMCWDTEWNGFLWLLSLLTRCIQPNAHEEHTN